MKIIDDFLWKDDHKFFVDLFQNIPWFICNNVTFEEESEEHKKQWYMTHLFYHNTICSEHYTPILEKIIKHKNFPEVFSMMRIKGNMYPGMEKLYEHASHSDQKYNHMGAIYYINTNNGYTIIEGQKVESIANRIVFFDPSIPHNSTNCTDQSYRMNINFNFFGEKCF